MLLKCFLLSRTWLHFLNWCTTCVRMLLFRCGLLSNKCNSCLTRYKDMVAITSLHPLEKIKNPWRLLQPFSTLTPVPFVHKHLQQPVCSITFVVKISDGYNLVQHIVFSPKYSNLKAMLASVLTQKKLKSNVCLLFYIAAELSLKACFPSKAASLKKDVLLSVLE